MTTGFGELRERSEEALGRARERMRADAAEVEAAARNQLAALALVEAALASFERRMRVHAAALEVEQDKALLRKPPAASSRAEDDVITRKVTVLTGDDVPVKLRPAAARAFAMEDMYSLPREFLVKSNYGCTTLARLEDMRLPLPKQPHPLASLRDVTTESQNQTARAAVVSTSSLKPHMATTVVIPVSEGNDGKTSTIIAPATITPPPPPVAPRQPPPRDKLVSEGVKRKFGADEEAEKEMRHNREQEISPSRTDIVEEPRTKIKPPPPRPVRPTASAEEEEETQKRGAHPAPPPPPVVPRKPPPTRPSRAEASTSAPPPMESSSSSEKSGSGSLASRQAMLTAMLGGGGGTKSASSSPTTTTTSGSPPTPPKNISANANLSTAASALASKLGSGPSPAKSDLSKYERMQKAGLPQGAIEHAMRKDGIDPALLFSSSDSSSSTSPPRSPREQPATTTTAAPQSRAPSSRPQRQKEPPSVAPPATPPTIPPPKAPPPPSETTASGQNSLASRQAMLAKMMGGGGPPPPSSSSSSSSATAPPRSTTNAPPVVVADRAAPAPKDLSKNKELASASSSLAAKLAPQAAKKNDLSKFERMQKAGLPQGAIEHAMRKDGLDPRLLFP